MACQECGNTSDGTINGLCSSCTMKKNGGLFPWLDEIRKITTSTFKAHNTPSQIMAEGTIGGDPIVLFDDSILEPIRREVWEAKRNFRNILRIHVTHDFYMQVKINFPLIYMDIQNPSESPIFGFSVVEHFEPCNKETIILLKTLLGLAQSQTQREY